MNEKHEELATVDLENVVGGRVWQIGRGLQRGYIDSLKGFNSVPNLHDGIIANGLRGELTPAVTQKPRPWLNGQSIDSLTRPMQLNSGHGLPMSRW